MSSGLGAVVVAVTGALSDPNTSYGSTAFGQITTTKIGRRQVMLGLKYYF